MKTQHLISLLIFLLIALSFGCASQIILDDRNPTPEPISEATPQIPVDDFEERLKSVQTGDFYFVYVFRRKDQGTFTSEDKKFLRENLPRDAVNNQITADEKAVVVGSNFRFPPENFDALKKRFKMEDYSPKDESKPESNANAGNLKK